MDALITAPVHRDGNESAAMRAEDIEREGMALSNSAAAIAVLDAETFELAAMHLRTVKTYIKRVHEVLDPIVESTNQAHRVAVEQRKALLTHAEVAERTLKERMATYEQAVERQRREAEEAAQRESERIEAEARAEAEAAERTLREQEETRRLEQACAAEAAGDTQTAERIISAPVVVPRVVPTPVFQPPVVAPPAARSTGVSFRDAYRAEVVSLMDLVRAVADGRAPITLVKADETALNALARTLKGAMNVPGVRVVSSRTVAARA